jgi:hypothetical protein
LSLITSWQQAQLEVEFNQAALVNCGIFTLRLRFARIMLTAA